MGKEVELERTKLEPEDLGQEKSWQKKAHNYPGLKIQRLTSF